MMKFHFWLATRMLLSKKSQLFSVSGVNALAGLTLGVSGLVVSMAVMSGFESTLQKSVADVTGQIQVLVKSSNPPSKEELTKRIQGIEPTFEAATRFSYLEAVTAHQGKLAGVILQGLDPEDYQKVLGLQGRLLEGGLNLSSTDAISPAVIGVGLAKNLGLKVGDSFRVVLPLRNDIDPSQFRRKIGNFKVAGILDLGKYDYNQRMILTSLKVTQDLAEIGERYSGLLLKFDDIHRAREITGKLNRDLGSGYLIRDWKEVNENLFEAVQIERIVVFFVILVIVLAAAFNAASTLYVNVITRYSEIGLLKAMGLSRKSIVRVFSLQGMLIGAVGLVLGLILGGLLCAIFSWAESKLGILPGSIYKIDRIDLQLRWQDLLGISAATLVICFIATLAPALRGSNLSPVEGLKNE